MTPTPALAAGHASGRGSRSAPLAMLIIGALLTVGGPFLGAVIGSFAMVPGALGYADRTVELAPSGTVRLEAEESVLLLAPVAELASADHAQCSAEAADGTAAAVTFEPASTLNTRSSGTRYESFARVTAQTDGTHTLTCDTEPRVIAAPPFEMGSLLGPLAWWTAGGLVVSALGVVLVIVGIVRLTRAKPAA